MPSFLYGKDWPATCASGRERESGPAALHRDRPQADVGRYLAGVAHAEVVNVNANPLGTSYRPRYRAGSAASPRLLPAARGSGCPVAGQGSRAHLERQAGRWAVVVMRPDASRGSPPTSPRAQLPPSVGIDGLLVLGMLTWAARPR